MNKQINVKNKNMKNYLHGKAPNKQKKNKEIFLGFLYFSNTQEESEKIELSMDNTMKKCEHRQLE